MTGRVKVRPSSRALSYRTLLAAGLILLVFVAGASPEPFGFLPAKEASRVRQILAALDKSLETWNTVEAQFAEDVRKARRKATGTEDAKRLKTLLESGMAGSWAAGRGPSLSRAESDTLKQARLLETALEPVLDRLDPAALKELYGELMDRARRVPGVVPEYLDYAGRAAGSDPAGARFAVRALLALAPGTVSLRLAPASGASGKPGYTLPDAPIGEEARIRLIREAHEALRRAAPALSVPELVWTGAEGAAAEAAARSLSRLPFGSRARILETSGLPGLRIVPAFLSGLSPEERQDWTRERGISLPATEVFLACLPATADSAPEPLSDLRSDGESRLRTLAILEREIARGASGISILSSLTDPALRLSLRSPDTPRSVRDALSASISLLASNLEAGLSRAAAGDVHLVETEELPGSSGFTALRAFRVLPDGTRIPVPSETLDPVLKALLSGFSNGSGKAVSGPSIGILTAPIQSLPQDGSAARIVAFRLDLFAAAEDADPSIFAALEVFWFDEFRQACRAAGIPPAVLVPPVLGSLSALCEARCRGLAGDAEVEAVLSRAGGPAAVQKFWEEAFLDLEAVRRAIAVFAGREVAR